MPPRCRRQVTKVCKSDQEYAQPEVTTLPPITSCVPFWEAGVAQSPSLTGFRG